MGVPKGGLRDEIIELRLVFLYGLVGCLLGLYGLEVILGAVEAQVLGNALLGEDQPLHVVLELLNLVLS